MSPLIIVAILGVASIGGYVIVKGRKVNTATPENIPNMNPPEGDSYNANADLILGDILAGSNPVSRIERQKGVITTPGVAGELPVAMPTVGGNFYGVEPSSNKSNKPIAPAPTNSSNSVSSNKPIGKVSNG